MADGVSIIAQKRKIGKRPSHLVRDGGTKHLHRDVLPVVWPQEEGKHIESVELRFCAYLKIQINIEGSVCPHVLSNTQLSQTDNGWPSSESFQICEFSTRSCVRPAMVLRGCLHWCLKALL